ncbi:MAG: TolC family protein [Candidatus Omnitrophica bacterium]|nr:TolC family protein [Candidatus Omnitrophota bacterium]
MNRKVLWIIGCGVILFSQINLSFVWSDATDINKLSLEKFIGLASKQDTRFEQILIDRLGLQYRKALGLPAGEWVLVLKSKYNFLFDPDDEAIENTVSLSRLFPYTGTEISGAYSSTLSANSRDISSEFELAISQPIAENALGKNTRLLGKIIGLETEVANFQIIEAYEDYLATLIQLYYNWYSAYENLNTARNSYNENLKLLDNIKERQKFKIALPVDVNKVSLQVAIKKEALISLENKYDEYLNLIKQSIRQEDQAKLQPENPLAYENVQINFNSDYLKFNTQSRTAKILKMLEDKTSFEVNKYANELLPSINIIAGYLQQGSEYNIKDPEQTVYAGLSFDWPMSRVVEKARFETAKIELKKTKLSSENIHLKLHTDLKNLNEQIIKEKELIAIAEDKIIFAQSIVEDDQKNYSLGRITLNDLIDEVNKLEDNKFNKIFHEIQLKRLIIEWLRLNDQLIKQNDLGS